MTGFEPARAEPNGFQDHLLNRSDTLSVYPWILMYQFKLGNRTPTVR